MSANEALIRYFTDVAKARAQSNGYDAGLSNKAGMLAANKFEAAYGAGAEQKIENSRYDESYLKEVKEIIKESFEQASGKPAKRDTGHYLANQEAIDTDYAKEVRGKQETLVNNEKSQGVAAHDPNSVGSRPDKGLERV